MPLIIAKKWQGETQIKGNYLLLATIDGKELKYIIRKGIPDHDALTKAGLANITGGSEEGTHWTLSSFQSRCGCVEVLKYNYLYMATTKTCSEVVAECSSK